MSICFRPSGSMKAKGALQHYAILRGLPDPLM